MALALHGIVFYWLRKANARHARSHCTYSILLLAIYETARYGSHRIITLILQYFAHTIGIAGIWERHGYL